jgi:hypothetical protein
MWRGKMKMTTTRWVWPSQLRTQRYAELHGRSAYKDVFNAKFLDGLEKRRDLIEGRYYKALAIQIPLFLLLAFSLVKPDLKLSIVGFSIDGVRGLREILLVVSSTMNVVIWNFTKELQDINEMLSGVAQKLSRENADALAFLRTRYGLNDDSAPQVFEPSLLLGKIHLVSALLAIAPAVLFIGSLVIAGLVVQFLISARYG